MKPNKFLILLFSFFYPNGTILSQAQGNWVWMNGSDTVNMSPVGFYGTLGIPSSSNTPPGLYETYCWTDTTGNFWLFGGNNFYGNSNIAFKGEFSALWKFNPTTNQWTWVKGPKNPNVSGVYGTKGVPSITNNPGSRSWGGCSWTDKNGKFWLYGGFGTDAFGNKGLLSDLWKFDPNTLMWTWMKGPNTINALAIYGTKGVPSTSNNPEAIQENNCTWVDDSNNLWFYGGLNSSLQGLNSLWKYDQATNNWAWIWGSQLANVSPVYGTVGIDSPTNNPGGRTSYCSFYKGGRLYFYGAMSNFNAKNYNDIWSYNIKTGNWRWELGPTVLADQGIYSLYCDTLQNNYPASRFENRAIWADTCGFYMFSGMTPNDLWYFDASNKNFIWLKGSSLVNPIAPSFGSKNVIAASNLPPSRGGASAWKDKQGSLWLFGGLFNSNSNDMWRYIINPSCYKTCQNIKITESKNILKENVRIYPNPFKEKILVEIFDCSFCKLYIMNVFGLEIRTQILNSQNTEVNLEGLNPGVYLVKIISNDNIIALQKLIKQ